jgi:hypothetical protein
MPNKELVDSIYNRHLEVYYNEWYVRDKDNNHIKIELQGKIKCPLLNCQISSLACSKIMDKEGWPRAIDPNICKKCNCYVSVSIKRFQEKKGN